MSVLELTHKKTIEVGKKSRATSPSALKRTVNVAHVSLLNIQQIQQRYTASKERLDAIKELLEEYEEETDPDEQANILRTLDEISGNEPLELPTASLEHWEKKLISTDAEYAKVDLNSKLRNKSFLKKYFSFRAKASLATQEAIAKKSGLSRSYIAVIESGEHLPQQKTLQKLAKAFGVDVGELLS